MTCGDVYRWTRTDRRQWLNGTPCTRRSGHPGEHANRGSRWSDVCPCTEVTFVPTVHAMCMNCGGHNPRCVGLHCPSHPCMLAFVGRFGTYCPQCS